MKPDLRELDTWGDKAYFFVLLFLPISLYLPITFSNVAIASLTAISIYFFFRAKSPSEFLKFLEFGTLMPILLYLLIAISFLYSEDTRLALRGMEIRLPLLIMPLACLYLGRLDTGKLDTILKMFIFATCIGILFSFINAALRFNDSTMDSMGSPFAYHNLASLMSNHAGYLSMIVACSAMFTLNRIIGQKTAGVMGFSLLFFLQIIFVMLLSTFSVLLGLLMAIGLFIVLKWRLLSKGVIAVFLIVTTLVSIPSLKYAELKWRGVSLTNDLTLDFEGDRFTPVSGRLAKWYASSLLIIDHPLGVGIGDAQDVLNSYYRQVGFEYGANENFDPHNLFLSYSISAGVMAGVMLVGLIGVGFFKYYKSGLIEGLAFLTIFLSFSMSESTLSRNKGLVFFMYFFLFFIEKVRRGAQQPGLDEGRKNLDEAL